MLRTHRQRVPAMLVVACVGMMVYAVAGAAPGDGRELAPAATSTTDKGDKDSTPAKDGCEGSATSTTSKDGDGKGSGSTPTTGKDGDGKGSGSTPTTGKDGDGKGSTPTTGKDGKGGSGDDKTDVTTAAAVKGDSGSTPSTGKDGKSSSGSSGKDGCEEPTTPTTDKDRKPNTPTTDKDDKDGKGSTTTTRKGGGDKGGKSTTTTTDRRDRPTTSTTEKRDTVEPTAPSGGDPGSGSDSGSTDPGATPIEPQEAPPEAPPSDPGPDGEHEEAGEDWAVDEGPYDMSNEESWELEEGDEFALGPMASPGEPEPIVPAFGGFSPGSRANPATSASRPSRSGRVQQLAAPPVITSGSPAVQASPGRMESAAVSRRLAGVKASATESAFPADVISTPKVFPINRRDPLAAAALVLLVGVSRELFKAWRRRVSDFWPA